MPAGLDGNRRPIQSPARAEVVRQVADTVAAARVPDRPLLVAIDGIDGSGKSTFGDELGRELFARGISAVRATIDSFHNPRAARWRRGKTSPVGFYLDSHDLGALCKELLEPWRAGAGAEYRVAVFDEPSDQPIDAPVERVRADQVLLFDGIFALRPELDYYWDVTVFLDGKERVDLQRLGAVLRGAPKRRGDLVEHVLFWGERLHRYTAGMQYYLDLVDPMTKAHLVVDNNDLARPRIRPSLR
jgi:uridine kinase